MEAQKATVAKIRPVSWRVSVPGEECANYVRNTLSELGINCSEPERAPDLQEPPMFSFMAMPKGESPLTAAELRSIFDQDNKIEVAFEA